MTPTEILHKIVETENKARSIYSEAAALQEGFDDNLREHVNKLKEQYAAKEEQEVAAAEKAAVEEADKEIEKLNYKLESELTVAKSRFESQRDSYVDKIFRLAVNLDA